MRPSAPRTLRASLRLSLVAMMLPLLLLGGFGIALREHAARDAGRVSREVMRGVQDVALLQDHLRAAEHAAEAVAARRDGIARRRLIDAGRAIVELRPKLHALEDGHEHRMVELALGAWNRARDLAPDPSGRWPRHRRDRFGSDMAAAQDHTRALLDHVLAHLADRERARAAARRRELIAVGLLLVLAALVAVATSVALRRGVAMPLARLRAAATALGAGDLSHRVPARGAEEIRAVAESFNAMADQLVASREQLADQAGRDALTGLANRRIFLERTEDELRGGRPAVLFVDLDDFKAVNDSLGHAVGDALLVEVAGRLAATLRPGDLVARLGGDEFALLLCDRPSPDVAGRVADRLRLALAAPVRVAGHELRVRASVGVAVAEVEDATALLRNADIAMYEAKAAGKDARRVYEPAMYGRAAARLELDTALRDALAAGALTLSYQPVVELTTGRVIGLEALARWSHGERGPVPPSEFIPVAEATGLIVPLGAWVLDTACRFGARVVPEDDGPPPRVGVNVSPRQIETPGFVDQVRRSLAASGLPPARLVLEITETTVARDPEAAAAILSRLRALGVRVAIDDFGAGYSSLGTLRRLPVDVIKIDRAFVADLTREDRAMISAMVAIAEAIGAEVVAEGVEEQAQLDALRELGCGFGQGFHLCRPLPAADAERYVLGRAGAPVA